MAEIDESDWPIEQRSYPPGTVINEFGNYYLQVRDEEGRWITWGTVTGDRDELTRIQAGCARLHPKEKRRVIQHILQVRVDEVEGDGEGETSLDALMARNDEATARLLKKDQEKQTRLPNGKTLRDTLGEPGTAQ